MKVESYKEFFAELEKYENEGVRMKLDDIPASPMQIVTAHMVKEESSYMRDYVWDEKGHIRELTFHPWPRRQTTCPRMPWWSSRTPPGWPTGPRTTPGS